MKFELRSESGVVPKGEENKYREAGFIMEPLPKTTFYFFPLNSEYPTIEISSIEDLHALHKHFGCPIVYTDDYLEIQNDEF